MNRLMRHILLAVMLLLSLEGWSQVRVRTPQERRSPRQMVKGGLLQRPDTLPKSDTLQLSAEMIDSLRRLAPDSLALDSLIRVARAELEEEARREGADSLLALPADSLLIEAADSLLPAALLDSLNRADSLFSFMEEGGADSVRLRKGWLMSDSMSLSKVCWISTVLPGYGQIYNKQYWKLPILYGLVGTGIGMFIHENNQYKPLKQEYEAITSISTVRTPELDALQKSMIRHNTRRQIYLVASVASYLYFIGDAAVNYSTNDVSHVKRATTLACICPGAGQIYNKSYWKVPFVVGGFASMAYCIDWNNRGFQRFKKAYSLRAAYDKAMADYNADPENNPKPTGSTDEFRGRYAASFLKNLRDNYRRNRDLCIIITAGLYMLQAIDAHVDAHLQDFDVSDDLSMTIEPKIDYNYIPSVGDHRATYGFSINVKF